MPQVFRIGPYWIYFWANESRPCEPVHVHISEGSPVENATKVWITASGKCYWHITFPIFPQRCCVIL